MQPHGETRKGEKGYFWEALLNVCVGVGGSVIVCGCANGWVGLRIGW